MHPDVEDRVLFKTITWKKGDVFIGKSYAMMDCYISHPIGWVGANHHPNGLITLAPHDKLFYVGDHLRCKGIGEELGSQVLKMMFERTPYEISGVEMGAPIGYHHVRNLAYKLGFKQRCEAIDDIINCIYELQDFSRYLPNTQQPLHALQ